MRALQGTERYVNSFFWSADSQFVAFVQDGKMKKVAVAGGPPSAVAENVTASRGGAWSPSGLMLVGSATGLIKISPADGTATPVTALDPLGADYDHVTPAFLL